MHGSGWQPPALVATGPGAAFCLPYSPLHGHALIRRHARHAHSTWAFTAASLPRHGAMQSLGAPHKGPAGWPQYTRSHLTSLPETLMGHTPPPAIARGTPPAPSQPTSPPTPHPKCVCYLSIWPESQAAEKSSLTTLFISRKRSYEDIMNDLQSGRMVLVVFAALKAGSDDIWFVRVSRVRGSPTASDQDLVFDDNECKSTKRLLASSLSRGDSPLLRPFRAGTQRLSPDVAHTVLAALLGPKDPMLKRLGASPASRGRPSKALQSSEAALPKQPVSSTRVHQDRPGNTKRQGSSQGHSPTLPQASVAAPLAPSATPGLPEATTKAPHPPNTKTKAGLRQQTMLGWTWDGNGVGDKESGASAESVPVGGTPARDIIRTSVGARSSSEAAALDVDTRKVLHDVLAPKAFVRHRPNFMPLSDEALEWFKNRGISRTTLDAFGVAMERVFCPAKNMEVYAIAFPYTRNGQVVNIKYRLLEEKVFWQVKGAEKIVFGYDQARLAISSSAQMNPSELVVVEGEMDALSVYEAGIHNVVSVPDGAPAAVKDGALPEPEKDTKYSYLYNCKELFLPLLRVVMATDNDIPGRALAAELSRRLGKERCFTVQWPLAWSEEPVQEDGQGVQQHQQRDQGQQDQEWLPAPASHHEAAIGSDSSHHEFGTTSNIGLDHQICSEGSGIIADSADAADASYVSTAGQQAVDSGYRKDANEVLVKDGAEKLRECIERAEPLPIQGLLTFKDFQNDIWALYNQEGTTGLTFSSGWASLDEYYKVVPGEVTVVTGVPNMGKSEWLDALLVNTAEMHGWSSALCSFEKSPAAHYLQLVEKKVRKPARDPPQYMSNASGDWQRMSEAELRDGLKWVEERFYIIHNTDRDMPTVDWVLERAAIAVLRYGIRCLVIDPYNELDHSRGKNINETEYVSTLMGKLKRFAQVYEVAVWLVAHPRQLQNWGGEAPDIYTISGSAHFINKADNVVVVHRPRETLLAASRGMDVSAQASLSGDRSAIDSQWSSGSSSKGATQGPAPGTLGHSSPLPSTTVHIILRKVRNKTTGIKTDQPVVLSYDRRTGRYDELKRDDSDIDVDVVDVEPSSTPTVDIAVYQLPSDISTGTLGSGGADTSHAVGASVPDVGADETLMPDTPGKGKAGTGGASCAIEKPEAGDNGNSASSKIDTVMADAVDVDNGEPDTAVAGVTDEVPAESDTAMSRPVSDPRSKGMKKLPAESTAEKVAVETQEVVGEPVETREVVGEPVETPVKRRRGRTKTVQAVPVEGGIMMVDGPMAVEMPGAPEAIEAYGVSEAPEASEASEVKEEEGHPQQDQPLRRRLRRRRSTSASDALSDNSQGGSPSPADAGVEPNAAVGSGAGDTKRSNTPRTHKRGARGASIAIEKPVADAASDKGVQEKRVRGRPRKSPK